MKAYEYIVKVARFQLPTAYRFSTAEGRPSRWADSVPPLRLGVKSKTFFSIRVSALSGSASASASGFEIVSTNADKTQLFAESVERHYIIQSDNFDLKHFDKVNCFIEDNYQHEHPDDSILLNTPMTTERTWMMIKILCLILTPKHPLG